MKSIGMTLKSILRSSLASSTSGTEMTFSSLMGESRLGLPASTSPVRLASIVSWLSMCEVRDKLFYDMLERQWTELTWLVLHDGACRDRISFTVEACSESLDAASSRDQIHRADAKALWYLFDYFFSFSCLCCKV